MKNLPIGIQTFRDIREGNYTYVDKTKLIFELVNGHKGVYFLSRPRRFGKSLTLSTLKEIFEGNKELFQGLWMYEADYDWKKYPIIRLDFSSIKTSDVYLRFVLLTGVSKFSKAGVLSGLNNLNDISMVTKFSSMLGITHEELKENFKEYTLDFSNEQKLSEEELLSKIKQSENGL